MPGTASTPVRTPTPISALQPLQMWRERLGRQRAQAEAVDQRIKLSNHQLARQVAAKSELQQEQGEEDQQQLQQPQQWQEKWMKL